MVQPVGWRTRARTGLEIFIALGLLTSVPASVLVGDPLRSMPALAGFTTLTSGLLLVALGVLQKLRGESILSPFLPSGSRAGREAALGALLAPSWFVLVFITVVLVGMSNSLAADGPTENPVLALMRTPTDYALFVGVVLFTGGFTEELQRAFIISRFREGWGPDWLGAALYAVFFGFGHRSQGLGGAVFSGLFGLGHGLVYVWRGSVLASMVSHGLYDLIEITRYWLFGPLFAS